jgi:hypothetical protein
MSKLEIAFQSLKVVLGIFIAVLVFGYTHQPAKLGSVYGSPAFNDYTDATLATTTLANYPGILHTLTVTTPVASSVIKVYDAASTSTATTLIATISIPSTPITAPFTLLFDNIQASGLTVAQSGATSTFTAEYQQN